MGTGMICLLFITGLLAGFYSGLVGTGGNIILIPVLDYVLSHTGLREDALVKSSIAHSLLITFFSGISVSWKQYRIHNFYPREILLTAVLGIFGSLLVTYLIRSGHWYDKRRFDMVFLGMLLLLSFKLFADRRSGVQDANGKGNPVAFLVTGAVTGMITALSGLGGGLIMIPVFTDILKMPIKKASSISIGVIALFALPISINYLVTSPPAAEHLPLQTGYISWAIVLPVLAGIFLLAPAGVKTAQKMQPGRIRLILAIVITLLCIKMIYGFYK